MTTVKDLADKTRYIVKSLDRTRELTSLLSTDLQKRSLGKSAFVFVESGILILRRLNKLVSQGASSEKASTRKGLNQAAQDYEESFALLRDKMHAHRQEIPTLDALKAWHVMHDDYLAYFRNEFATEYENIRKRDATLPKISNVNPLPDRIRRRVRTAMQTSDLYFNMSIRGLFSASGANVLLGGPARRGQEVLDAFDSLNLCSSLNKLVEGLPEYQRLLAAAYLTEAIAMFDNLYDDQNPDASLRQQSFLECVEEFSIIEHHPLEDWATTIRVLTEAKHQIDAQGIRDRTLRNKFAAHIDSDDTLIALLNASEAFDWIALWQADIFSQQAFKTACQHGPSFMRTLALHRTPLKGAISIEHGASPSYDG